MCGSLCGYALGWKTLVVKEQKGKEIRSHFETYAFGWKEGCVLMNEKENDKPLALRDSALEKKLVNKGPKEKKERVS